MSSNKVSLTKVMALDEYQYSIGILGIIFPFCKTFKQDIFSILTCAGVFGVCDYTEFRLVSGNFFSLKHSQNFIFSRVIEARFFL